MSEYDVHDLAFHIQKTLSRINQKLKGNKIILKRYDSKGQLLGYDIKLDFDDFASLELKDAGRGTKITVKIFTEPGKKWFVHFWQMLINHDVVFDSYFEKTGCRSR